MITVLEYLVIAALIGLVVFALAVLVFGRGEQMAALSPRTSPAELPEGAIGGDDVRRIRFSLALRGYRMSDVDWTLDRLSDELDRLHRRVAELGGEPLPLGVSPSRADEDLFPQADTEPELAAVGVRSGVASVEDTAVIPRVDAPLLPRPLAAEPGGSVESTEAAVTGPTETIRPEQTGSVQAVEPETASPVQAAGPAEVPGRAEIASSATTPGAPDLGIGELRIREPGIGDSEDDDSDAGRSPRHG